MSKKDVKFESGSSGTYSITVDHPLVNADVGDKIKFKNRLTGDPVVTIQFFVVEGDAKSNADGLCKGVSGNQLTIAGGKSLDCEIQYEGYVKYDVSAVNHTDLDPVVIIDKTVSFVNLDQFSSLESQFQQFVQVTNADIASLKKTADGTANFDGMTLALVAIGALIVGYLIGKK